MTDTGSRDIGPLGLRTEPIVLNVDPSHPGRDLQSFFLGVSAQHLDIEWWIHIELVDGGLVTGVVPVADGDTKRHLFWQGSVGSSNGQGVPTILVDQPLRILEGRVFSDKAEVLFWGEGDRWAAVRRTASDVLDDEEVRQLEHVYGPRPAIGWEPELEEALRPTPTDIVVMLQGSAELRGDTATVETGPGGRFTLISRAGGAETWVPVQHASPETRLRIALHTSIDSLTGEPRTSAIRYLRYTQTMEGATG